MMISITATTTEKGTEYIVVAEFLVQGTAKGGMYGRHYLQDDGSWGPLQGKSLPTREEATAFAMGCGVIRMDFLIEDELFNRVEEALNLATKCLEAKLAPTFERLFREGRAEDAHKLIVSAPLAHFTNLGWDTMMEIYLRIRDQASAKESE